MYQSSNLNLAVLITATGDDVFTKVRFTVSDLESKFFESEGTVAARIEEAVQFLTKELSSFENLQILLSVWQENVLYLECLGQHQAYLFRDSELITLTENLDHNNQLISGHLQKGDRLLFITDQNTSLENISKLVKLDVNAFEEEVSELWQQTEKEPIAAILVDYHADLLAQQPLTNIEQSHLTIKSKILSFVTLTKVKKIKLALAAILILIILTLGFFIFKNRFRLQNNLAQTPTPSVALSPSPSPTASFEVNDWPVFLSLSLIKKDFSSKKMSLSVGQVLMLDEDAKTLVLIDLKNKSNQILGGEEKLGSAKAASLNGDFAFSYAQAKGIVRIDTKALKSSAIIKPDSEWGNVIDIYSFASNVYLLDNLKNQIWKYVPIVSGYSDKQAYFKDNSKLDLAGAKRVQIDSSVWILKSANEIDKFTAGVADNFSIGGLDKPLSRVVSFFVSDQTDNVYLLDGGEGKVVVVDKKGKFVAQYRGDKFKTATDLVVDEQDKKLYLLEGGKIYQVELR